MRSRDEERSSLVNVQSRTTVDTILFAAKLSAKGNTSGQKQMQFSLMERWLLSITSF
jgi:hypothetical protein